MEIASINSIREYRDLIREKIKNTDKNQFINEPFGHEQEYSYRTLLAALEQVLTEISALTKKPNQFIQCSSYNERAHMIQLLNHVNSTFENPRNLVDQFEALKLFVRNFNLKIGSEKVSEHNDLITETLKLKHELEQELLEIQRIRETSAAAGNSIQEIVVKSTEKLNEFNTTYDELILKKDEVFEKADSLSESNSKLEEIIVKADAQLQNIASLATESGSNEKLISSFAARVH